MDASELYVAFVQCAGIAVITVQGFLALTLKSSRAGYGIATLCADVFGDLGAHIHGDAFINRLIFWGGLIYRGEVFGELKVRGLRYVLHHRREILEGLTWIFNNDILNRVRDQIGGWRSFVLALGAATASGTYEEAKQEPRCSSHTRIHGYILEFGVAYVEVN